MLIPPQRTPEGAAGVQMLGFAKRFGSLQALEGVSLTVAPGSLHALLGENGAGKSTLVKCLIGVYRADAGSVLVDGRERAIHSPRDAAALGLGMIFQHFTVVPGMTVAENLALAGRDLPAFIRWGRQREQLQAFMQTAPFPLALHKPVATLSAGEKQKLEILKALYTRRRFLVLDEPTSVLTPQEADEVLGQVRTLCRAGLLTALIITHKFREVFGYCDEVTVLRKGRLAGAARVADTHRDELAAWMMGTELAAVPAEAVVSAGRAVPEAAVTEPAVFDLTSTQPAPLDAEPTASAESAPNEPVPIEPAITELAPSAAPRLAVRGLRVMGPLGLPLIDGLDLDVRPGEIVGIAGVSGNGQRELMAALTGTLPIAAGTLSVDGRPYRPTRAAMTAERVRSLPEEPLHNACVGALSVAENLALRNFDRAPLARGPWLSGSALRAQAREAIAAFKVKTPGPGAAIRNLSGGNVQRAVLARELGGFNDAAPRLLLVANPCFGLDFQATAEIHARLRAARDAGCGVLLISEDLDEILALASRVLVLSHGHVALQCAAAGADIGAIGRAMAGDGTGDGAVAQKEAA